MVTAGLQSQQDTEDGLGAGQQQIWGRCWLMLLAQPPLDGAGLLGSSERQLQSKAEAVLLVPLMCYQPRHRVLPETELEALLWLPCATPSRPSPQESPQCQHPSSLTPGLLPANPGAPRTFLTCTMWALKTTTTTTQHKNPPQNVKKQQSPKEKGPGLGAPTSSPAEQSQWHPATLTHSPGSRHRLAGAALKTLSHGTWAQNTGSNEYT